MIITCVHQGFELYGSDRSFVETVSALRASFPDAMIEVVLARRGPIVPALEPFASRITIEPLWILRRKDLPRLATFGLLRLPAALLRAHARLRRSDLVYVNTSVVVDYMLASRFSSKRAIIHVHEIATGATRALLRALVRFSGARVIFNSRATRDAFALPASQESRVIYNGLKGPAAIEPKTFDGSRPLHLLMIGRFSRIKGQEVLVKALALLPEHLRPDVKIVGGAFEDDEREQRLVDLVAESGLAEHVALLPFVDDPAPLYRWADIVTVPSRLPESLGRVAIEAMAYGRPPVVSDIGGLPEVVEDGRTGWLVRPDQPADLAQALRAIIENPAAWTEMPAAGRERYENLFSESAFQAALTSMISEILETAASPSRGVAPVPLPRGNTA
ncbi:MAG: glycosyltransferase family 4 protein [Beijerinckiaceae bacterium]|nr:glycosyltransferase family 4 protein [Beijerinckiaceae bacterium]